MYVLEFRYVYINIYTYIHLRTQTAIVRKRGAGVGDRKGVWQTHRPLQPNRPQPWARCVPQKRPLKRPMFSITSLKISIKSPILSNHRCVPQQSPKNAL